jgi:hypothetical protein
MNLAIAIPSASIPSASELGLLRSSLAFAYYTSVDVLDKIEKYY